MFQGIWRDLRFGRGVFLARPGIALAVIGSLALGIGCNTAIFTLLDALFLRPLPTVADGERLFVAYSTTRDPETGTERDVARLSYPNYRDLRDLMDARVTSLAACQRFPVSLSGGREPVRVTGLVASANYFSTLGVEPVRGRFFTPSEEEPLGGHPVAILSHETWHRHFGADEEVLGRKISVNGHPFSIVGVAPRGFRGTDVSVQVDVFLPMAMYVQVSPWPELFPDRDVKLFELFGRLPKGSDLVQAEAALDAAAARLEELHPVDNEGMGMRLVPMLEASINPGRPAVRERYLAYGRVLSLAASLILLLACVNVGGLLFVRGMDRVREVAIRQSLGASRGRLVRQLLTESSILVLAAGLVALPTARLCLDLLWRARPPEFAGEGLELRLDPRILVFSLGLTLLAGLLAGLVPALRSSRPDLQQVLKTTSGGPPLVGRWGLRNTLVMAQVALATVALVCAGLFLRGLAQARSVDLGFAASEIAIVTVAPGAQGYSEERARELYDRILAEARAVPGVVSAALSENRLLRGGVVQKQVFIPGETQPTDRGGRLWYRTNRVTPGYFEMAGIPLLSGRDFGDQDQPDVETVVIINRLMAEREFGGAAEAIGRRIHFDYPTTPTLRVVGVAEDAKYRRIHESPQYFIYLSSAQHQPVAMTLHARVEGAPTSLLEPLRSTVRGIDPSLPLSDLAPLDRFVTDELWMERMSAGLLTAFGALALVLAAVGLYGVMRYSASQRHGEVAVRIALGARRGDALRRILFDGVLVAGLGLALGLVLAAGLLKITVSAAGIESRLLHGLSIVDPMTYGPLALLLLLVAVLGSYFPARRAASSDPATALRAE